MMTLIVTVRKEVPDQQTGEQLFDLVKLKLADRPDLDVKGHLTNHFTDEEPPE